MAGLAPPSATSQDWSFAQVNCVPAKAVGAIGAFSQVAGQIQSATDGKVVVNICSPGSTANKNGCYFTHGVTTLFEASWLCLKARALTVPTSYPSCNGSSAEEVAKNKASGKKTEHSTLRL